jgi:hypothetical protein
MLEELAYVLQTQLEGPTKDYTEDPASVDLLVSQCTGGVFDPSTDEDRFTAFWRLTERSPVPAAPEAPSKTATPSSPALGPNLWADRMGVFAAEE